MPDDSGRVDGVSDHQHQEARAMSSTDPGVEIAARLDAALDAAITAAKVYIDASPGAVPPPEPAIILPVAEWSKLVTDAARVCGYMRAD